MISVRPLTRLEDLQALAGPWDLLVSRSPRATPFSSAAWNLACWRHLGRGKLLALAFERGGALVGVAPMYRQPGPRRRLRWIGMLSAPNGRDPPVLDWMGLPSGGRDYPVSDYADLVAESGAEAEVAEALWAWLEAHRDRWQNVDLRLLPAGGVLAPLAALLPARARLRRAEQGTCLLAKLPGSWAEYVRAAPPNMRPCLERIPRKLRREHETRFERVAAPAQLPGALEHLFRLHSLRWEAAGERGIFATQAIRALHREVALRLLELGWLELWLLRIDGEVAAAQYNFRLADVVYFYASGYVPGRYDRYAAGRTLMAHTIRTAIEEGVRAYDFLRGDHAYKRRFGAEAVPQVALEGYAGPLARAGLGAWDAAVAAARTVYRTARRRAAPHVRRRAVAGPPGARAATSS